MVENIDQSKKKPDVIALEIVLQLKANPFLDVAGVPRLKRIGDGNEIQSWPIRSRQIEAWVAKIYYGTAKKLIDRRSLDRVLLCLEGLAEDNSHGDIELCDIVETEPILGLLIRHVRHEQQVKIVAGDLLNTLHKMTKDSPHLKTKTWPGSPEALGRRIRRLLPWIRKAGISVEFIRDKHYRWILLRDGVDCSQTEPSPEPSSVNSFGDNTFQHSDSNSSSNQVDQEVKFHLIMNGDIS